MIHEFYGMYILPQLKMCMYKRVGDPNFTEIEDTYVYMLVYICRSRDKGIKECVPNS